MNITRSPVAAVGAAMLALSLAACGTTQVGSATAAVRPVPPRQLAMTDAAANLRAVPIPPGARRDPSVPASLTGVAGQPPQALGQIDDSAYWTVRGTPQAVLAGIRAKLPHSFAFAASGTIGGLYMMPLNGGLHPKAFASSLTITLPMTFYDEFTLPAGPKLTERAVFVSAALIAAGEVFIRVDAQDSWPMRRTAATQVPSTVTSVIINGVSAGPIIAGNDVIVTSPGVIRRIVALVNGLTLRATGVAYHCSARFGEQYRLVFDHDGTTVATADLTPSACDVVGLQTRVPLLLSGAHGFLTHLAAITRLPAGFGYRPGLAAPAWPPR
jgi:hypothetical protein